MKVFFQIKFSITAKEETQIEEELSNYVLTWNCSTHGYYPPVITQSSLDTPLRIRPARKFGPIMWDTVSQKIRSFRPVYEK